MEYENLIDSLIKDGYLKTPEIIEAFKAIDRANFVSNELKGDAYLNVPLSIGFGQTISQPLTVAFMLELLQPKKGEKILDVGAGSGWTIALLAFIVGDPPAGGGKIIGVERIPELKEKMFGVMRVIRVYMKEPGKPKSEKPMVLSEGSAIKDVAEMILKGFSSLVREIRLTGPSGKFVNQKVGLGHRVKDGDVVEFHTR